MPRVTRSSLGPDNTTPTRSSPRATTQASSASSTPSKTRGRRGEKETAPEEPQEKRSRGRSSSQGKGALEKSPSRQSRTPNKPIIITTTKTVTPSPSPKRSAREAVARSSTGRSQQQSKKDEQHEKKESTKVVKKAEKVKEEAKAVKKTQRVKEEKEKAAVNVKRSQSLGKAGKTTPSSRVKTPTTPKASPRSARSRRSGVAVEEKEEKEVSKTQITPTGRTRGQPKVAATTPSRSRRSRGGDTEKEDKESTELKVKDKAATNRTGKRKSASPGKKENEDLEIEETEDVEKGKENLEKKDENLEKEDENLEKEDENLETDDLKKDSEILEKDNDRIEKVDEILGEEVEKLEKDDGKLEKDDEVANKELSVASDVKEEEVVLATNEKAAEPELPLKIAEVEAPVLAEPMESNDTDFQPVSQTAPVVPNGEMADSQELLLRPGVKRKLNQSITEIEEEKAGDGKRARINGNDALISDSPADVEMIEASADQLQNSDSEDAKLLGDFVLINSEDVPAADSLEVAAVLPQHPPSVSPSKSPLLPPPVPSVVPEVQSAEDSSRDIVLPPVVLPLTEAEVTKVYAAQVQASRDESDEVSSMAVEVGSIAGSDLTGTLSRGLDISEIQSVTDSIEEDESASADASIVEEQITSDAVTIVAPTFQEQSNNVSPAAVEASAVSPKAASVAHDLIIEATSEEIITPTAQPLSQSSSEQLNALEMQDSEISPCTSPPVEVTETVLVEKSSKPSDFPPLKSSRSVTQVLGNPDPAFLAAHSSPSILNRAYVPNPAIPVDQIDQKTTFSLVSYNILAECHRVRGNYYVHIPEEFLTLEYRHKLLLQELEYLNGDIVCLQEVSPAYYEELLLPEMKRFGYEGTIKCRTKEGYDEGEATFYKTDRFVLESSKGVSLTEVAQKEIEAGGLSPEVGAAVSKYLDRADVVLITRFCCKTTQKTFTVGNVHVVWDNLRSPDVKCIQAACAIKEVKAVAGGENAPHIICGDFNSSWDSPVYQLIVDGYLSDTSIRTLQSVENLDLTEGSKSLVNHLWRAFQHTSSNLRSAYSAVTGSEPEVTSHVKEFASSIDYIFYSSGSLIPVGVLKTIDGPVVLATGGLPSKDIPSDHLSMKAVMAYVN